MLKLTKGHSVSKPELLEEEPGQSLTYEIDEKTVFDIPEALKDWNIYLAETRIE